MKKFVAILLAVLMLFSLVACGGSTEAPETDNGAETSAETTTQSSAVSDNADPMDKTLSKAGLELSAVTPDEKTFDVDFDADDDEITFYMEKGTEKNVYAYMNKLLQACKAASDDGKLYEANFNFYMGSDLEEFTDYPTEEANEEYMYLMQFGYMKNGATVTVTAGSVSDMHPERSDDIYYPVYTVSFGF